MTTTAASAAKSALSSPAMKWAAGGWTLFIAENLILSENRTYLIDQLGDDGYHGLYGTLSTAAVASILYGYRYKVRGAGPFAFPAGSRPPPGSLAASFVLQALALGMASQSLPKLQIPVHLAGSEPQVQANAAATAAAAQLPAAPTKREWKVRCPFDFTDSKSQTGVAKGTPTQLTSNGCVELHGLDRISRHPGLWSFGLLGFGNALLVPSIPTRVWLSMPLLVALIGGGHTDSRHRRGMGGQLSEDVDKVTSNIPFAAMVMGTQENGSVVDSFTALVGEVKVLNAAVAAGAAALWVARRGRGGSPSSLAASLAR